MKKRNEEIDQKNENYKNLQDKMIKEKIELIENEN